MTYPKLARSLVATIAIVAAGAAQAASVFTTSGGPELWSISNLSDGKNNSPDWRIYCSSGCNLLGVMDPVAGWDDELAALNALAGTSFSKNDWPDSIYKDDPAATTFSSDALYIFFKAGNTLLAFFENTSGGANDYAFWKYGNAAGLSHAGRVGEVTLPATLGLLGLGLAGLGAIGRRNV